MEVTGNKKYPWASSNEVDEQGRPIDVLDLTGSIPDNYEEKKKKPTIELGAVTSASSSIALTHDLPHQVEQKMTATTTTPNTVKANSRKLTFDTNGDLTSSQQTHSSGKSSDTLSPTPSQPPSSTSKLKRQNPFTKDGKDRKDGDYIDIDAQAPKKPRLLFPSSRNANPSSPPTTATRPDLASLRRSLDAAAQQIQHQRGLRRKAERRAAEYAQHGAPMMRTAARLTRWVADMYAEHRRQQGRRREEEVEAFLREIKQDVGEGAWRRLLWLGTFLRDNLDEGEQGKEGGGSDTKHGAAKLEKKMNKQATGRDGATDSRKVAEVGKSGGAVAMGTKKLEDSVSI